MPRTRDRRDFVTTLAAATLASVVGTPGLGWAQRTPSTRRKIAIGGKRITVIDAHAHLNVAEVATVVKGTPFERQAVTTGDGIIGPARLASMDRNGVDIELLTQQGAWWYSVEDRALARDIAAAQNEGTAAVVARNPDRFVGMTSMPLQFPELAAEMLEDGIKRFGFKGGGISAGWVGARNLTDREYDVFWSKAQELGAFLFMHPGGTNGNGDPHFAGLGALPNTIGNPLETTIFLSRLIYEGTLDRFPGLKICGAHGGGYLPSYMGRTDAQCTRVSDACAAKKRPVDAYFKSQLMADCMVFREDALRHLVAEMGTTQIVFGTDAPFDWPVTPDFILNARFLSDAQKEQILGGNVIKLLKLSPAATA
jgi:aminocarboxymuconate-semialdehyde decarboxylase